MASVNFNPSENGILELVSEKSILNPLDRITVKSKCAGTLSLMDGTCESVYETEVDAGSETGITIGGTLGFQNILLKDGDGAILDCIKFKTEAKTNLKDENGEFAKIFDMLEFGLYSKYGVASARRYNGKTYQYFSAWFQDHMYLLLAQKYFYPEIKSGVDLYTHGQREDGMIPDNYKHAWGPDCAWERRFGYGNFVYVPEDPSSSCNFIKVPVENMSEFSYIECVYMTWQACGDDAWMAGKLDSCIKAVEYCTNDPYAWSEKYQLMRRGYTIDIWDFQSNEDTAITGDTMKVELDKTRFNIHYGDNVRMAYACHVLADMLEKAGRKEDSERIRETGKGLKERIDKLAWNGEFYRHMVPEDPEVKRDFGGTDEAAQVTLSNTWALNRGVTHEQAVGIIKTYQRIKDEKPESSPGEWYMCYPPFEKGWGKSKWNYMNGGVSPIAAGELAKGCFDHGFESYGIDILRRIYALSQETNGKLWGGYKGAIETAPERTFECVDLRTFANADIAGEGNGTVPVLAQDPGNDIPDFPTGKTEFHDIPFDLIDPEKNGRKAVLGLSIDPDYTDKVALDVNRKAGSLYLLHIQTGGPIAGTVTFNYTDGTSAARYMSSSSVKKSSPALGGFWQPTEETVRGPKKLLKLAWTGKNSRTPRIGVWEFGLDNPNPDKKIKAIELEAAADGNLWLIFGLTLSDAEAFFTPDKESTLPDHWGAAECMYGLMDGLAGIRDEDRAMKKVTLSPRWAAAGEKKVSLTAKYEASDSYVAYEYEMDKSGLSMTFTGSSDEINLNILLPDGFEPKEVTLNGEGVEFKIETVENSNYLQCSAEKAGVQTLSVKRKT